MVYIVVYSGPFVKETWHKQLGLHGGVVRRSIRYVVPSVLHNVTCALWQGE
jgi:hypothetical protein